MEPNKLKKMMKKVEDVLAAASFAEEGERRRPSPCSGKAEGCSGAQAGKDRCQDREVCGQFVEEDRRRPRRPLCYRCRRRVRSAAAGLETELAAEGIRYRLIRKSGCLKQAVIDYTNREKEILFAVVESPGSLDEDCSRKDTMLAELWQKLKCPLVVVMDGAGA